MPTELKKAKRVPLGEPIDWTDEDLDAMTSPEALMQTIEETKAWWKRNAPKEAKGLLDAENEE